MTNTYRFYAIKDVKTQKYLYVNYNLYLDSYDYRLVDHIEELTSTKSTSDIKTVIDKYIARAIKHTGMDLIRVLIETKVTRESKEIKESI